MSDQKLVEEHQPGRGRRLVVCHSIILYNGVGDVNRVTLRQCEKVTG